MIKSKYLKLRHLIIALIGFTFILFIASNMFSSFYGNVQLLKEHSLEKNQVYAEKLAQMVNLYLEESLQTLEFSASNIAESMDNEEELIHEVNHLYGAGTRFNSVIIANADGLILAGSPSEFGLQGKSITSEQGLQLIKNQEPNISDPYKAATGNQLITISYPIFSKDNEYKGLINSTIYIHESNYFYTLLDTHFYQDGSYVFVVDSTGRIIYHQNRERIDDIALDNKVVQSLLKGENGAQSVINTEGIEMLAGYSTVDIANWGIVAQTPKHSAIQSVDKQVINMFLIELPLIILSVIIAIFATKKITKPLQSLAEITEDSVEEKELEKLKNLNVWYYEALQLKKALIHSFSFLHSQVHLFMDKSTIDPLTGLTNRRAMDEILQKSTEKGQIISAIMLDIDRFKKVNDTYGHAVGDEVLQFLATEMKKNTRDQDICCRYGGEEFIILLPETTVNDAYQIAERLRKTIETKNSPCGHPITFSAGVASFPNIATTPDKLVQLADQALYEAKQTGRNRVIIAQREK